MSAIAQLDAGPLVVGRYELAVELARGGLATVYLARLLGDGGLQRTVAVKRLHAHFRTDGEIATMFLDEARLALRVRHPNVIHAVDVVLHESELFIVMEYIEGVSLSQLIRDIGKRDETVPLPIASSIITNVLHGLHAAHTTRDERGVPLAIVHRDVSPQNVLVGSDGLARVLDFGVAKAVNQAHVTRTNEVKGKLTYMPPEALLAQPVTAAADIFSAGIVLWEMVTGYRLFFGDNDGAIVRSILESPVPPPSSLNAAISADVDAVILRALERDPRRRFATAEEMALAVESVLRPASPREVASWVRTVAADVLSSRAELVARVEGATGQAPRTTTAQESGARIVAAPPSRRRGLAPIVIFGAAAVVLAMGLLYRRRAPAPAKASTASAGEAVPPAAAPTVLPPLAAAPAPPPSTSVTVEEATAPRDARAAPSAVRPPQRPHAKHGAPTAPSANQYPRW